MSVISVLSAKSSPGVSTSVAALATFWPGPVLVIDADPAGGDLLSGWNGRWWVSGELRSDANVVSFATTTRHLDAVPAEALVGHVQQVPELEHVRLLAGVSRRAQAEAIGDQGWRRVAHAARDLANGEADVLVDLGRWEPALPWPLLHASDLVLLGLRPTLRHLRTAMPVLETLQRELPQQPTKAAVLASTRPRTENLSDVLELPVALQLPEDRDSAFLLSDGLTPPPARVPRTRPLFAAARHAARHLREHETPHTSGQLSTSTPDSPRGTQPLTHGSDRQERSA